MPAKRGNREAFIAAFRKTGHIGKASKIAGIQRGVHYRRYKADPVYKAAFDAACVEIAAKRSNHADQEVSLRSEIERLDRRLTGLQKEYGRRIRALETKLATAAPRAPRTRPTEADALLDQIARGMGKKPFSRLSPAHQDAVREIAARIQKNAD